MDWASDDAVLSAADLKHVFKFEPKETTVLRMLAHDEVSARKLWAQGRVFADIFIETNSLDIEG